MPQLHTRSGSIVKAADADKEGEDGQKGSQVAVSPVSGAPGVGSQMVLVSSFPERMMCEAEGPSLSPFCVCLPFVSAQFWLLAGSPGDAH